MSAKLKALTACILDKGLCRQEEMDSWVDQVYIDIDTRVQGEYVQIGRHRSRCTVFIERFRQDARLLSSVVITWINENDYLRENDLLPAPEINVTPLDSGNHKLPLFDIEITLYFIDEVLIIPDENGIITYKGERWSLLDTSLVNTALNVDGIREQWSSA